MQNVIKLINLIKKLIIITKLYNLKYWQIKFSLILI